MYQSEKMMTLILETSPADFDGHTEFPRLDVNERLDWLSEISLFVNEMCGAVAA